MDTIGPYRLIDKIAEGGMGEVWLAEQDAPLKRTVAIKVIKVGMDTREFVSRFDVERQTLALMSHPGIARVYDAGSTPQGRPYLVMEYVSGTGILEYCNRHHLTIRDRLHLFTDVCAAVQHAHHKAIIHRDLKPSNVLISVQDGTAVPKVIDFGISRSVVPSPDETMLTLDGHAIGTPEYMSPEQARVSGEDVDTRSDVYSLGAILYELLTDTTPLELHKAVREGPGELWRRIRDDDPPAPSARARAVGAGAHEVAETRGTTAAGLCRELSGDLDSITLKALEKDRTRRYGSPSDLAADIHRHLSSEPVSAYAPSTTYKMNRFVKRHRFGVAVAAASFIALIAFSIAMAYLAARVAQERDNAYQQAQAKQQVVEYLKNLFSVSDPSRARGSSVTAREILDEGVKRLDQTLTAQPEVRADLLATMGEVYDSLGLYAESEQLTRRALDIQRELYGEAHPSSIGSSVQLSWLLLREGRLDEAQQLAEKAVATATRELGQDDDVTLRAMGRLGAIYARARRLSEAEPLLMKVMTTSRRVRGSDHEETLAVMNNLALLYHQQKRVAEAARLDEEIVERRTRALGEDHPMTLMSMNNLAYRYGQLGRHDDARKLAERAVVLGRKVWGATHPLYGVALHTLAELDMTVSDYDMAESHLLEALAIYRLQPGHEYLPLVLYQLAQVTTRQGRIPSALEFLREAVDKGYKPGRTSPAIADDPHLAALRGNKTFDAIVAKASKVSP